MKPSLQKILTKLAKNKVELNMVKNVETNSKKSLDLYESGVKKIFAIRNELDSAIDVIKKSLKLAEDALQEGKELEKLADNIGADLKGSTEKAIQDAFGQILASKQTIKDLEKAKNSI